MNALSEAEIKHLVELKRNKRFPWSKDAFSKTITIRDTRLAQPPRFHLIMLAELLDSPATIQRLAGLSATPAIEQTETLPEDSSENSSEEMRPQLVRFCRVGDAGLANS